MKPPKKLAVILVESLFCPAEVPVSRPNGFHLICIELNERHKTMLHCPSAAESRALFVHVKLYKLKLPCMYMYSCILQQLCFTNN